MSHNKVAAGFVIFRRVQQSAEYLMMQTSYGIHHWTPPKGHVDPEDGNEMVTAFRETYEEAGLEKRDLKVYDDCKKVLVYEVNGKPKTVIYWLAELINKEAIVKMSDEHQDFKWLNIQKACIISEFKDMKDTLLHCDKYVRDVILK